MSDADVDTLLTDVDAGVREVVERLRETVRRLVPDATEEPDRSARLIGYSYRPGTYTGLIVAIAPHAAHVNLMFSRGVELLAADTAGLLEGTGKKARHIKLTRPADVDRPELHALVEEAARRTPR